MQVTQDASVLIEKVKENEVTNIAVQEIYFSWGAPRLLRWMSPGGEIKSAHFYERDQRLKWRETKLSNSPQFINMYFRFLKKIIFKGILGVDAVFCEIGRLSLSLDLTLPHFRL